MLAGTKPFAGPDLPTLLRQLQFEEPAPLGADVPAELAALVAHAMAKNPGDRPRRVAELSAVLVRFRRQYQADTRKLLPVMRSQYDATAELLRSVDEAGDALGVPPADE